MTTPPPSPPPLLRLEDFVPYRLSVTANLVSDVIASAYEARFGLKVAEWRLVAVLAEDGPQTQQSIGQRTRMDKVTVSRAAIALCDRALLERRDNPQDKRSHLLVLTEAGIRLYEEVAPVALSLEKELLSGIGPAEMDALMAMLKRLEQAALTVGTGLMADADGDGN
ncbi:MarR family winged helix-turn-helix transcriptional regulator [Niveispirillum irakense]|uniref:MarR family winged helix-turn-helix transcriptional regulator n=1 Tax=Niveispirillum irakense TaxID=34011 RepID=UPI000421079B|nr:MarR family winged helix-turn-helix transcriptional regulator [Niveispirillum irakense]